MIFQKRVKKKLDLEFYIGNHTIDIVHENTHLGTRTSSTGNCNVSLEHFSLFLIWEKHRDINRLKPSLACKIFDTMTTPILSYNCEIWGANQNQDFKTWDGSPIEKAPAKTKVLLILT